jgi:UMF1 family MFS transporter
VKKVVPNSKIINGWAMYDWANSVFVLTITSSIFPIFYENVTITKNSAGEVISDYVTFFGFTVRNTSLYSWSFTFAFLLIALLTPLLSGIADYSGKKKSFMKFFVLLGSISVSLLYFFDVKYLEVSMIFLMLATIGYSGSIVFYNAFLPEIAPPEMQDKVSAKGFALGYFGSTILLIINLLMIMKPNWFFDISSKTVELMHSGALSYDQAYETTISYYKGFATRISFLSVGIWWFGFSLISFSVLPDNPYHQKPKGKYIYRGYLELKKVWNQLKSSIRLKRFLLAYFVYNMGVQTIMYTAITFAKKEISDMPDEGLIISIIIIQVIAIFGAYFFSFLSDKIGNLRALMVAVSFWVLVTVVAFFTFTAFQFYVLAGMVGLVMGGVQSLSRSTYSKMLPETKDHSSYFGFYDITDKIGVVMGTLIYGVIYQLTGSTRDSIIALGLFFIIGLLFLMTVPRKKHSDIDSV